MSRPTDEPVRLVSPLPEPRPDLALREGYHSAQVPVEVRLNTNESPYPPPREWLDALLAEASDIAYNRYPDRSASALRGELAKLHNVHPEQVFAANGSNEVLQSICLAYGGPGRKAAMFEPTYALHSHIAHITGTEIAQGQRRPDFTLDPAGRDRACRKRNALDRFPVLTQQPDGLGRRSRHSRSGGIGVTGYYRRR